MGVFVVKILLGALYKAPIERNLLLNADVEIKDAKIPDLNPKNDPKGHDDHASFDETCFEAWKNKWGRTYATREEELSRFQTFKQSLRTEEASYTGPLELVWMGLTDFADMTFEQFKIERLGFNSVDECFPSDSESDDEMLAKNGMKRYFSVRMDDGTTHLIPSYPTNFDVFDFKGFIEDLKRQVSDLTMKNEEE
ncbi:hypothetical protein QVD17_21109 [Tagetes erecta]|uniref:Cathepsin propeptide inhibitor domain-containing protein n=1 Tax=Tagetes erecta TaxID=13708 RepID=A0AAD8KQE4_TARER|nr:hypothetical protein QVD17_21109 [Tagetes erecta]